MSQFSTHELVSLEKSIGNVDAKKHESSTINDIYDIGQCLNWIKQNEFKRVCLQLSNDILPDASEIALAIEKRMNQTVYILADSAYESCCIDYAAAEHINADALIHFGESCYSQTESKIPILQIPEKLPHHLRKLSEGIQSLKSSTVIVYDQKYHHLLDQINKELSLVNNFVIQVCSVKEYKEEFSEYLTVFIGQEGRTIAYFQDYYKVKDIYVYDLFKQTLEKYTQDNRAFKRRHFLVEAIKDAMTIGIVLGTLAVQNYLIILNRMRRLCKLHGKKSYILSVGKPNVAKLANFPEVDIFVVIACSVNRIYDHRDYYKPIVTPYDLEVALNPAASTLSFNPYDFNEILANELPDRIESKCDPDISMISGKIRTSDRSLGWVEEQDASRAVPSSSLVLKKDLPIAERGVHGADYLGYRCWQGLEQNVDDTEPKMVQLGRHGLAMMYDSENK